MTCIELMPANAQALRDQRHSVSERDFLTMQPSPLMDRVVMNPPFARQADIKHVLHALRFLRDGGRLVSVMSASVTFRENRLTQDFRALVSSRSGSIEELPEGAFQVIWNDGAHGNRDYPRMTERMTLSEYRQHVGVSKRIGAAFTGWKGGLVKTQCHPARRNCFGMTSSERPNPLRDATCTWATVWTCCAPPDASVDSVVTDPPYGLSFMGQALGLRRRALRFGRSACRVLKTGGICSRSPVPARSTDGRAHRGRGLWRSGT